MPIDHVSAEQAPVFDAPGGQRTGDHLLWGDRVLVTAQSGGYSRFSARGLKDRFVKTSALGGRSLLEFYFVDVGQGDGVLIRTPDHRHVLIDGGFPRKRQSTGKNAADFVDWKFCRDYGGQAIAIDAMIASHNDADHYGGLWDLLSDDAAARSELDADAVTVEAFYHAGLSWWQQGNRRSLGPSETTPQGRFWTRLLGDRASLEAATGGGGGPQLAGEWRSFLARVAATRTAAGAPTPVSRLAHTQGWLPGFAPAPGQAAIKVIAPVEYSLGDGPALRVFGGGDSKNTNGQSVLLRVDYGRTRTLLTGDLNTAAQAALLEDYAGSLQEFECDVAKACHHGSDDVSYRFLQAMRPAVTVISSGDNEGHDHPRPDIVAASATSGHPEFDARGRPVSPLVYSTELARSHQLSLASALQLPASAGGTRLTGKALHDCRVHWGNGAGRSLAGTRFVSNLIYGLVNVRTDGDRILCATRNEADRSWQIKTLRSRF